MSEEGTATASEAIEEQAVLWHLRLQDADGREWDEFSHWLQADDLHNAAYDRVLAAENDIDAVLSAVPVAANENHDEGRRARWRWIGAGTGVAAAAAIVMVFAGIGARHAEPFEIATGPGQQRTVRLNDGTQIALNGSSIVVLDRSTPRLAELRSGEAVFTVVHNASSPFTVTIGNRRVEDVGTIFNVRSVGKSLTVAVKEGSVRYTSGATVVPLKFGQSMTDPGDKGAILIRSSPADTIASWRTGRLDYTMQPLGVVAQDISRYLGVPVRIDASLAGRQFSGTIRIERDSRFFARLGGLLGVTARHDGNGWVLAAR